MPQGEYKNMPLELFLVGVVAAEMPATFAPAALQAQAIAARSYVLSHSAPYGMPRHGQAAVCCDPQHCQAYASTTELQQRWGNQFDEYYEKVERAVADTAGLAICYHGRPVETPYCSTCGGYTQAARDIWGQDIPYLQAVPCYWDANSPRASTTLLLSLTEAARKLAVKPEALATMSASYGAGGAVTELKVGEKQYSGLQIRQMLALPSANCQWLIDGGNILFSTRGFGHGVGLCQYGADGMAEAGYTAQEILLHYYTGVEIKALY